MFALEEDTNEGHEELISDWSEATVELPKLMQKLTDALNEKRLADAIDIAEKIAGNMIKLIGYCLTKGV